MFGKRSPGHAHSPALSSAEAPKGRRRFGRCAATCAATCAAEVLPTIRDQLARVVKRWLDPRGPGRRCCYLLLDQSESSKPWGEGGWTSGSQPVAAVTLTAAVSITALFSAAPPARTALVQLAGAGSTHWGRGQLCSGLIRTGNTPLYLHPRHPPRHQQIPALFLSPGLPCCL